MPIVDTAHITSAINSHKRLWGKYPDFIKKRIYNAIDNQVFDNPDEWKKEVDRQISIIFKIDLGFKQGELF